MNKPVRIDESWKKHLAREFEQPYFARAARIRPRRICRAQDLSAGRADFPRLRRMPFRQGESRHPRAGPLSRRRARRTAFVSQSARRRPAALARKTSSRKSRPISAIRSRAIPTFRAGREQGVLLLNATLTVREAQAGSHQNKGWEQFTDAAVHALSREREGSCSCCGAPMRGARAPASTAASISCWNARIPRRFPRITAFSAAGIFRKRTTISSRRGRRRSSGDALSPAKRGEGKRSPLHRCAAAS